MNTEKEIEELRQEVEDLKKQLATLYRKHNALAKKSIAALTAFQDMETAKKEDV